MAIATVLKTVVRKDFWVRIPGPPFSSYLNGTTYVQTAPFARAPRHDNAMREPRKTA